MLVNEIANPELNENALQALRFATRAHAGQTRKSGGAYIKHPMEVARFVKQFKQSNNLDSLIKAAWMHDTLEDTDTTYDDLVKEFGGLVVMFWFFYIICHVKSFFKQGGENGKGKKTPPCLIPFSLS